MYKLAIGSVLAAMGGTVVAGGVMLPRLLYAGGTYEIPNNLPGFQKHVTKDVCLQKLFPGLEAIKDNDGTAADSSEALGDSYFDTKHRTDGCLTVNWHKSTKPKDSTVQWFNSNFRLMWAVKGEDDKNKEKGFLVFLVGSTPKIKGVTDKELTWEGVVYTLDFNGEGNGKKWTIGKKKEIKSSGSSGKKSFKYVASGGSGTSSTDDKFPRPGTVLGLKNNPTFWNFFEKVDDLNNICNSGDDKGSGSSGCPHGRPTQTDFRGYWTWEGKTTTEGNAAESGEASSKLSDWTQEMDKWWKEIFGDDAFKAKDMAEKHRGKWEQQHLATNAVTEEKAKEV